MKEIAIIGEAPGRNSEADLLSSRSCERLCDLLELGKLSDLTRLARVVTLLGFCPEGSFPQRAAGVAARSLELSNANIFLGRKVAACFGLYNEELLEWYILPGGEEAVIFPHPSGRNLWWNNPENAQMAKDFLWELFYEKEDDEQDSADEDGRSDQILYEKSQGA